MFIYKALDGWCRQPNKWGEGAGRLGFVVPLVLCGSKENADLRRLFGPLGRWTIKEIVDLEVIWKNVFDADVLPIVLIAEARPPRLGFDESYLDKTVPLPKDQVLAHRVRAARMQSWIDNRYAKASPEFIKAWETISERNKARWEPDSVIVKLADKSCVDFGDGTARPAFHLESLPENKIDYADLFTPDGRIVTRMTPERRNIIGKLYMNEALASALKVYWYKRSGAGKGAVSLSEPSMNIMQWEKREMISRGIVYAGGKKFMKNGGGHTVYKAENIVSGGFHGDPQDINVDISGARNRYLMDAMHILPKKLWAVAMIATCPNAVSFDPTKIAFTDTATLLGMKDEFGDVPIDLLFLSRIYRYFYILVCRMSYLNMYRSHVYPANTRLLPWNDKIASATQKLESLRPRLIAACEAKYRTEATIFSELSKLPLKPFRDAFKDNTRDRGGKVEWSESLLKGTDKIELASDIQVSADGDSWKITISQYMFDWVRVGDEETANGLAMALNARAGTSQGSVDRDMIVGMPIPADAATQTQYSNILDTFKGKDHTSGVELVVDEIDGILGPCLGLDEDDLAFIKQEMTEDPFLKNINPRWPATETRLHGYRTGLDSSERYN